MFQATASALRAVTCQQILSMPLRASCETDKIWVRHCVHAACIENIYVCHCDHSANEKKIKFLNACSLRSTHPHCVQSAIKIKVIPTKIQSQRARAEYKMIAACTRRSFFPRASAIASLFLLRASREFPLRAFWSPRARSVHAACTRRTNGPFLFYLGCYNIFS